MFSVKTLKNNKLNEVVFVMWGGENLPK